MKKVSWIVVIAGAVVGLAAVVLTHLGNPANMGFCIACFLRDITGAVGMHGAAKVQYVRPEIIGLVLGAFIMSVATKEFRAKAGSSPATRFVLGAFVMIGALAFLGRPLVEATGSLRNFRTQALVGGVDEQTAFHAAVSELLGRLTDWHKPAPIRRVLALHASQRATSNTLALWELVRAALPADIEVQEICLRNGTMADCNGCSYTACLHFGEQGGCFYGGPMVDEVYPAIRRCDALVMLCANYNDALAANLTACINRLTALFRQNRIYAKRLFGLVVSGYSGGDLLARQLISALNMNKSFFLPPRFCLLETANERGSLIKLPGIDDRAAAFARRLAAD